MSVQTNQVENTPRARQTPTNAVVAERRKRPRGARQNVPGRVQGRARERPPGSRGAGHGPAGARGGGEPRAEAPGNEPDHPRRSVSRARSVCRRLEIANTMCPPSSCPTGKRFIAVTRRPNHPAIMEGIADERPPFGNRPVEERDENPHEERISEDEVLSRDLGKRLHASRRDTVGQNGKGDENPAIGPAMPMSKRARRPGRGDFIRMTAPIVPKRNGAGMNSGSVASLRSADRRGNAPSRGRRGSGERGSNSTAPARAASEGRQRASALSPGMSAKNSAPQTVVLASVKRSRSRLRRHPSRAAQRASALRSPPCDPGSPGGAGPGAGHPGGDRSPRPGDAAERGRRGHGFRQVCRGLATGRPS